MGGAVDVKPQLGVGFVLADFLADFGIENLRPAAGHAAQARFDHLLQNPADRLFRHVAEPADLHRRPGFDVQFRPGFVDHADHVDVPIEFLQMMQAAHDMNFGGPLRAGFLHAGADHVIIEGVSLLGTQVGPERAKRAAIHADICGVKMDVGVVVGVVAVFAFADDVRQPPERQNVRMVVQKQALIQSDSLAGLDFVGDLFDGGGGGEGAHGRRFRFLVLGEPSRVSGRVRTDSDHFNSWDFSQRGRCGHQPGGLKVWASEGNPEGSGRKLLQPIGWPPPLR